MIPTAEEFLKSNSYITQDGAEDVHTSLYDVSEVMISFAKLHVEAALKAAAENAYIEHGDQREDDEINKESILNYDLNQIK